MNRRIFAGLMLFPLAGPAAALEFVTAGLPTFAQGAGIAAPATGWGAAPSTTPWNFPGFTSGGLDLRIGGNMLLGVSTGTGTMPLAWGGASRGLDFATTSVKLGYQIGKLTPYVTTSITSFKDSAVPGLLSGFKTTGDLLAGRSDPKAPTSVGAGFNYELTDSLHVGVGASFSNNR